MQLILSKTGSTSSLPQLHPPTQLTVPFIISPSLIFSSPLLFINKFSVLIYCWVYSVLFFPFVPPCFFYTHITEFPPFCVFSLLFHRSLEGWMSREHEKQCQSLVSLDTSQPAIGGKLKGNLSMSRSNKSSHSVVILDEPSNQNQDRIYKDCRAKLTEKMFFRAFSVFFSVHIGQIA